MKIVAKILFLLFLAEVPVGWAGQIVIAPEQGDSVDLTPFLSAITGFTDFDEAVPLDGGGAPGDDYLLVRSGEWWSALDLHAGWSLAFTFRTADLISMGFFQQVGRMGTLRLQDTGEADILLGLDWQINRLHGLALSTGQTFDLDVTSYAWLAVTGAGQPLQPDSLLITHSAFGSWNVTDLFGVPQAINVSTLFSGVLLGCSQLTWADVDPPFQGYLGVVRENSPTATPTPGTTETPTPAPSATPTPGPISTYRAVIVNGLGETLSAVTGTDPPQIANNVANTGIAPNQVLLHSRKLYVTNSLSNTIQVFSALNFRLLQEFRLPNASNPFWSTFTPDGKIFTSLFKTNQVAVLDSSDGRLRKTIALPNTFSLPHDPGVTLTYASPQGILAVGGKVYVALGNLKSQYVAGGPGCLAILDPEGESLDGFLAVNGRNTTNVAWDGADTLFISNAGDFDTGGSGFQGNGSLNFFSISQGRIMQTLGVPGAPFEMVVSPRGKLYVADGAQGVIHVIDLAGPRLGTPIALPGTGSLAYASGMALTSDGVLYVTDFNSDHLFLIDTFQDQIFDGPLTTGDGPDAVVVLEE